MSDETKPLPYQPKTDAELEQLAQDIVGGLVFHNVYHSHRIEVANVDLEQIWMPLAFMDKAGREWQKANNINAVYEYLDKAGPGSLNGMPGFMSCHFLNVDDSRRLHTRVTDIAAFHEQRRKAAAGE
ncbi:hypothetical protein [Hyphomicrobium sp.]|uniref:hypothetical protein n=1 Tax=Hyphomicrobium sp. TaxID=82 RepID=UPI001DE9FEC7|nr:hypothetical protein [Hyphomicrobium sp.]MBY0561543.1 hypothetical protein [Hyphomicrobium sp.]